MKGVIGGGYTAARPGSNGLPVTGNLTVSGNETVTGTSSVTGHTSMSTGQTSGNFTVFGGALVLGTAGTTLQVKEGTNASMGVATLVAGTVTVNTNKVTANSRIQCTIQSPGGTLGIVHVSARTPGASFTITSTSNVDTSTVAWIILEPAP